MDVNRLPGPITMSSASAIARSASSEGRTSAGVSQTRSMPEEWEMRDWPSTRLPSSRSACEREWRPRDRPAGPGAARTRLTCRTASSKSPP